MINVLHQHCIKFNSYVPNFKCYYLASSNHSKDIHPTIHINSNDCVLLNNIDKNCSLQWRILDFAETNFYKLLFKLSEVRLIRVCCIMFQVRFTSGSRSSWSMVVLKVYLSYVPQCILHLRRQFDTRNTSGWTGLS